MVGELGATSCACEREVVLNSSMFESQLHAKHATEVSIGRGARSTIHRLCNWFYCMVNHACPLPLEM